MILFLSESESICSAVFLQQLVMCCFLALWPVLELVETVEQAFGSTSAAQPRCSAMFAGQEAATLQL